MSTRGCVAIQNGTGWRGVYNHSDSYPWGLGAELHEHLQGRNLRDFAWSLMKHDDWKDYLSGGVCPYCGRVGLGQPHSISGIIYGKETEGGQYPDPERKHHCHDFKGPSCKVRASITDRDEKLSALFLGWVYVVDPLRETIKVLKSVRAKGRHKERSRDRKREWYQDNYKWVEVTTVPIKGRIVDWSQIEIIGRSLAEAHSKLYDKEVVR